MRAVITVGAIILAIGGGAYFFFSQPLPRVVPQNSEKISPADYLAVSADIRDKINEISPTPPTEARWEVSAIEFVQDTNYAYVTYEDTLNIFRLLIEIRKAGKDYHYRVQATFELSSAGWRLKYGKDLEGKKLLIKME